MPKITINRLSEQDLQPLIFISKKTFDDTFRPDNKDYIIDQYLKTSFTEEKMKAQLNNPNSEFYFAYSDNDVVGYLKININDAQTEAMGEDNLKLNASMLIIATKNKALVNIFTTKQLNVLSIII